MFTWKYPITGFRSNLWHIKVCVCVRGWGNPFSDLLLRMDLPLVKLIIPISLLSSNDDSAEWEPVDWMVLSMNSLISRRRLPILIWLGGFLWNPSAPTLTVKPHCTLREFVIKADRGYCFSILPHQCYSNSIELNFTNKYGYIRK